MTVSFGDAQASAVADKDGKWRVNLPAQDASDVPCDLLVKGRREIAFSDVLVGDVWIAAGQSNMEWPLASTDDGPAAVASAGDSKLRLLYLRGAARGKSGNYNEEHLKRMPAERFCVGQWQLASPTSARSFSAVAYYFAQKLRRDTQVPIGIICPAIGGTPAEAWVRREALEQSLDHSSLVRGNWLEKELLGDWCRERGASNLAEAMAAGKYIPCDDIGPNHSFKPSFMWDAGVAPLVPFAVSGFIWYQGESNARSGS